MSDLREATSQLLCLAVERVGSQPDDEQRYLELTFAVDRSVERGLRFADLLEMFRQNRREDTAAWPWDLAAGLTTNLVGRTRDARHLLLRALDEMGEVGYGSTAVAAFAQGELARVDYHLGRLGEGLERATHALQLARASNALAAEAYAHHYLGLLAFRQRDFEFARRHITAARIRFEEMGQRAGLARVVDSLAVLELELGEHAEARRLMEESHALKEALGDLRGQALSCGSLARLHLALGDYPMAMHYLDLEEALALRVGDERTANHVRLQRGELLLRCGQPQRAIDELNEAGTQARWRVDELLEAQSNFYLADALCLAGRNEEGLAAAEAAEAYFTEADDEVMRLRASLRAALIRQEPLDSTAVQGPLAELREDTEGAPLALALFETATAYRLRGVEAAVATLYAEALDAADPVLAAELAAIMRDRADSPEGRAWVEAMMAVKRQKDRLEEAYVRLRSSERLRDSLAQMIVHDLKNPLTAMGPWLETIRMRDLDETMRDEILQTVIDECDYLLRMINDLNDVGRLHAGNRLELSHDLLDIGGMMSEVARRLASRASASAMSIRVAPSETILPLKGDASKLQRVIENLVANAIKYGRPASGSGLEPVVELAVSNEIRRPEEGRSSVRVEVRDHGEGIAPAEAERIFEAYYQAEAGRKRKAGVGLGLAYCRMVVEGHGGAIWTQPNPGGGTIFAFRLPAEAPALASTGDPAPAEQREPVAVA